MTVNAVYTDIDGPRVKASRATQVTSATASWIVQSLATKGYQVTNRLQSGLSSTIVGVSRSTSTNSNIPNVAAVRRVTMSRLDSLLALKDGWDGPDSVAISKQAFVNYRQFIELLGPRRLRIDAEPMATPNGGIRMEWERGENSYVAEIEGNGGMFLCTLGPSPADDREIELPYTDFGILVHFFEVGMIVG